MIRKAAAIDTWWSATLSQHACSCIISGAEILVRHQITQVTQPPYSPDLVPCNFWLFPKLKSPLKGKRFQTIHEIQKTQWGSWWWLGELGEVPRHLLGRGLRHHLPMYIVVSYIFFNKCLYVSYYMAEYFLDRHVYIHAHTLYTHWCSDMFICQLHVKYMLLYHIYFILYIIYCILYIVYNITLYIINI